MGTWTEIATHIKNWANGKFATTSSVNSKQDALVSGTNIKTINSNSLLGSGNLIIGEGWTEIIKSADQTISSTTAANVTNFSFSVTNGKTYQIYIEYNLLAVTGGGTNYATMYLYGDTSYNMYGFEKNQSGGSQNWGNLSNFGNQMTTSSMDINARVKNVMFGTFTATSTKTINLVAALSATNTYYVKILKNSILKYREMP